MALLSRNKEKQWVLGGAKHRGELLEKVAEEDPSYLTFVWVKSLRYLSDAAADSLDIIMEQKKIPRELAKKSKKRRQ